MTPTKLLIGQIAIVFAVLVLGLWAATQWAAATLGYQQALGTPWFWLRSWPLYRPWSLFACRFEYDVLLPAPPPGSALAAYAMNEGRGHANLLPSF